MYRVRWCHLKREDLGGTLARKQTRRNPVDMNRPMLETRVRCSVSRGEPNLSPSTTNPRMKVHSLAILLVRARADPKTGEKARISAAGGFVDFGRVNGNLALSRAIGDFEFKKSADLSPEQQIVTAFPDVITHEVSSDDEFLVIACDGMGSSFAAASATLTFNRYLGLPIVASGGRIRPKRSCGQAGTAVNL